MTPYIYKERTYRGWARRNEARRDETKRGEATLSYPREKPDNTTIMTALFIGIWFVSFLALAGAVYGAVRGKRQAVAYSVVALAASFCLFLGALVVLFFI